MTEKELIKRLEKVPNITSEDKKVGIFFNNLNLTFHGGGVNLFNSLNKKIGEIDLIFSDDEENILFLVEVSKQKKATSQKIDHFLSKWSDKNNLTLLKKKLNIRYKTIFKLYFDWSNKDETNVSASLDHTLKDKTNLVIYKDDYRYFEQTLNTIGLWAKNDFYNFLDVIPRNLHSEIEAIGFYIGDNKAFVYADEVDNILKYSYVFRRRKNLIGYQRMVEEKRVNVIAKTIEKHNTITFPNSIILNSHKKLTSEKFEIEDCPIVLKINIPQGFCSCRIIDGQHRLMGFSKTGKYVRQDFLLPVVIFENLDAAKEIETFIEINHKQKKLDSNLILLLKRDSNWNVTDVEYFEKISVIIAEKLNKTSELKDNIYFGYAGEAKGKKITISTLHSLIKKNNFTGLNEPLFQKNNSDEITPYLKIKEILSFVGNHFKNKKGFFLSNVGLRILFRFVQIFERNRIRGNISISMEDAIKEISKLFKTKALEDEIKNYYGEGGALAASDLIIEKLKEASDNYENMETDLRRLK
jgi:DGQHR domain-containing protein